MEVKLQNSFLLFISSSSPSGRYQEWKPKLIFNTKLNNLKSWLVFFFSFSLWLSFLSWCMINCSVNTHVKFIPQIYDIAAANAFGGPGLMESVSFRSCHRWCFCISTVVFVYFGPPCHGLGLCVCLRSLAVPDTGTQHCVMIPWDRFLVWVLRLGEAGLQRTLIWVYVSWRWWMYLDRHFPLELQLQPVVKNMWI